MKQYTEKDKIQVEENFSSFMTETISNLKNEYINANNTNSNIDITQKK